MNNSFLTKIFSALLIVMLALVAMPVTPARAATLTVTTNAGGAVAVDTFCSLREAIINANNDVATNPDCAAGTGDDIIQFSAAVTTITVTGAALPAVNDAAGANNLTIDGGGDVTIDGGGAFQIFNVTAGTFTVQSITLSNGQVNGNGGAILYAGGEGLSVSSTTFNTNRTITGGGNDGGAIYHTAGTLSILNSLFTSNYTQDNGGAVYIATGTGTMTIDGSTFTTNNNGAIDDGGAIYLAGGTLSIGNTSANTFSGNVASGDGGAIFVNGGTLTVNNTSFTNTTAANSADSGGAIYHNPNTALNITNSTFTGNTSTNGDGGAIYQNNGTLQINGGSFTSNTTNGDGGAIYTTNNGTLTIGNTTGVTFGSNSADAGGAIRINSDGATISNSIFNSNTATVDGGGAIFNNDSSNNTTITLSTFNGNSTTRANNDTAGGAIYSEGTLLRIANSTFTANTVSETGAVGAAGDSARGGAIYQADDGADPSMTLINVTISGNSTSFTGTGSASGGSIYRDSANGTITLINTIVANGVANGAANNCGGTIVDSGNNIDFNGGNNCGGGFSNSDPLFGALTGSPAPQYFPLNSGSPAINAGDNADCTVAPVNSTSQNGLARPQGVNCEIGSYEAPATATLTLQKIVTNDNGGTALNTAWTLSTINPSPTIISGVHGSAAVTNAVVTPGNYTLSESVVSGYSNSGIWSCSGFTSGSQTDDDTLTLGAGDNVTCVITNDDNAPTLTLDKVVVNDNGGTALESAWTLTATGNPVTNPATLNGAGAAGSTDVVSGATFDAGTYDLSETAGPAGYTASAWVCVGGTQVDADTVTIALGQNVTCTITNNDNAPTLTLNKVVVNDNGGTAAESAWTLTATGNPVTNPATLSGAGAAGSTDVVSGATFDAGTYDLSESAGPAGYTASAWVCVGGTQVDGDTITIALGQNVTCTITNNDNAPTLTLDKAVFNNNGGTAAESAWTLTATGNPVTNPATLSGAGAAGSTDVVSDAAFDAGTYDLSESAGPAGYTASAWVCVGGTQVDGDTITIALGQNVTCTIASNDNVPTLTLDKVVVNDNGGTAAESAWTLTATGNPVTNPATLSGAGAAGSTDVVSDAAFDAGTYDLSESAGPAGYTASAWVCVGGTQVDGDTITLALGQTATCTITNDDVAPTLTLVKTATNDNGGTALDTDWTLNATGPTNINGIEGAAAVTNAVVSAGSYTLTESGGPAGYTQTGITCSGSDANGADGLTLLPGETVTCTFANNDDAPGLTLLKTVVSDNGGTALDTAWTLNAAGPTNISGIEGAAAVTNAVVSAGNYTLSESGGPAGYTQTGLSCSGAADADPTDGLTIALGETITCTFTNNDIAPTLTLAKTVVNDNGGLAGDTDWTLNTTGPTAISGIEGAPAVTNATVDAGNYTLGETGPANYTQTSIACTGGSDANGADGLTLLPGETVTCTFTNNDVAAVLTLLKAVVNDNGGLAADTAWTLNAAGPTPISGSEGAVAVTNATVSAGAYTLTESGGPSGYTQTGLSCSGAADANPNDGLTIALGETITCTFTNNDIAPTLTLVKDVTNNDGGTNVIGDWTLDATGPSTISGVTGAGAVTNAIVDAGSYSLGETVIAGYTQTAITCTGSDANGADGLTLLPGETVTCTFFNNDIGATLTLVKDVTNNNIGTAVDTDWTLTATGPTTISGVEGAVAVTGAGVSAGNYTLTESGPANYTQTAITCTGSDANGADGLTLALGETVTCTFFNDDDVPVLLVPNINSTPDTGDATIAEGEVIVNTLNVNQLIVQFNWDADNPAGTGGTDDVDNPNNYILLYSATGAFNTPSCAVVAAGGVVAPDIRIPVTTVAYSNGGGSGPFIATLNLSAPLTNAGYYRLFVCGTTSIVLAADPTVALSGNGAVGTDFIRNFQLTSTPTGGGGGATTDNEPKITVAALPATGFAPNRVTMLAEQPEEFAYTGLGDLWVEIPALGVKSSIVGVPQTADGEWDVTWLANNIGWLNGTAFPSWEGNSVVTAHVTNADGLDGPFANLKKLKFGDQIIVHAFGEKYIFEVRNSRMVKPFSTSFAFEDLEDKSYLTLITCQVYNPLNDTYLYRRVIRAVLVSVENE